MGRPWHTQCAYFSIEDRNQSHATFFIKGNFRECNIQMIMRRECNNQIQRYHIMKNIGVFVVSGSSQLFSYGKFSFPESLNKKVPGNLTGGRVYESRNTVRTITCRGL